MRKNYRFIDPPLEVVVGDAVDLVLECTGELSPRDWVGIYPKSIPTVPGVSNGRWRYISTFTETNAIAHEQESLMQVDREKDTHRKVLTFDPTFLPNHAGMPLEQYLQVLFCTHDL